MHYKIYATIIQKRLSSTIDLDVSKTQFGFWRRHSTTHALLVVQRSQDIGDALERLNIPQKILKCIW